MKAQTYKGELFKTDKYIFKIGIFDYLKKGDPYLASDDTFIASCKRTGYAGRKIVAYKPIHYTAKPLKNVPLLKLI